MTNQPNYETSFAERRPMEDVAGAGPPPEAVILSESDFRPLRSDPEAMPAAMRCVEEGVVGIYSGRLREYRAVDRVPGEFEGIRLSLLAGEGVRSGMRIMGNPPNTIAFLLFDGVTRHILALMDYEVLNSLRVGAIGGVAAKYLAPAGARTMGIIGSGWQAPPQVRAVHNGVPSLERIKVYSPTKEHRETFARAMTAELEIPVEAVTSTEEALADADVVDLCAPGHFDAREPLFELPMVKPGALIISMAGNQYGPEVVEASRVVAVSWENLVEQPAAKAPYDKLMARGVFPKEAVTPFGAVIRGEANPRRTPADRVIYHLEGGTVQDLLMASWGYDWARARGLGKPFDLHA